MKLAIKCINNVLQGLDFRRCKQRVVCLETRRGVGHCRKTNDNRPWHESGRDGGSWEVVSSLKIECIFVRWALEAINYGTQTCFPNNIVSNNDNSEPRDVAASIVVICERKAGGRRRMGATHHHCEYPLSER